MIRTDALSPPGPGPGPIRQFVAHRRGNLAAVMTVDGVALAAGACGSVAATPHHGPSSPSQPTGTSGGGSVGY